MIYTDTAEERKLLMSLDVGMLQTIKWSVGVIWDLEQQ